MITHAVRNLKLIITGCPCSGTMYVAKLLRSHGYNARHESLDYKAQEGLWWTGEAPMPEIEVSYTMNQWLDQFDIRDVPVIWLVREPTLVVNSWAAKGLIATGVADFPFKMGLLSEMNKRTANSNGLFDTHRIEDPDEHLLMSADAFVKPTLKKTQPPPRNENSHNIGRVVDMKRSDLIALKNGQEFFESYKDLYA
jgi:hypothetical protein